MGLSNWLSQTMLIERLVGVSAYLLVITYLYKSLKSGNEKRSYKALNTGLFFLVLLAFLYIPGDSADLTRIRAMIQGWGDMPVDVFIGNFLTKSSVPVAYLLYYVTAKIGIKGILPAICALVYYSNGFHIFKVLIKDSKYTGNALAYSMLVFMSSGAFLEVISDVRCFLAFSIVMRAIFDEVYFDKTIFRHLFIYIVAALLHPAAIVLIIIWLSYYLFFGKKLGVSKTILNILTILMFVGISVVLGQSYLAEMFTKASSFVTSSGGTYSYLWEYIIGGLQVVIFIFVLFGRRKIVADFKLFENSNYYRFSIVLIVLILGFFFEYNIFHRYITACSFVMIPLVAELLTASSYGAVQGRKYMFIQAISYLIVILACTRGNLCGFKFFAL